MEPDRTTSAETTPPEATPLETPPVDAVPYIQPPKPAPLAEVDRITSIDVLRGVALLGILIMNIQSYSMIGQAYFNPTAYGDLEGINLWVWQLSHIFADQKFMTIFSMLFGAGIIVFTERAEARTGRSAGLHYRRTGWLILFGLLHGHLLWLGDILYTYGMCGLVAYLFRRMRPGWLILLGFLAVCVPFVLFSAVGWSMQFWPENVIEQNSAGWAPTAEQIAGELAAYRGGWLDQQFNRSLGSIAIETFVFLIWGGWRAGGLMLIGMAMFKMGVFSAARSRAFYAFLIAVAAVIGIPVICYGIHRHFEMGWAYEYSMFIGSQFNYWASILVAFGWLGLVMMVCKSDLLRPLTGPFAAVGRMAFTNYILQTVICTTIFYGHGFGLYGYAERWQQLCVVIGVWGFQLAISPLWLAYFRFGPLEWLWRSLSYWRLQPMLRAAG